MDVQRLLLTPILLAPLFFSHFLTSTGFKRFLQSSCKFLSPFSERLSEVWLIAAVPVDAKAAGMRQTSLDQDLQHQRKTKRHALIASPPASLHSLLNCKCYCTFSFLPTFRAAQCKHTTSVRKFPNQSSWSLWTGDPPETERTDKVGWKDQISIHQGLEGNKIFEY